MKSLLILSTLLFSLTAFAGELGLFIFKDGLPLNNFEVVLDGKTKLNSNDEGSVFKYLKEGSHFIEIKNGQEVQSLSFQVADNEMTEITLNLFSNSSEILSNLSEPQIAPKRDLSKQGLLTGTLKGDDNKGIEGARVFIQGLDAKIVTDKKGNFKAKVPAGRYIVSFVHPRFTTKTLKNISVLESKSTNKSVRLIPAGLSLEDFVVIAPHIKGSLSALIEVRRNSKQVADVMGAEQISKSGDSDAASSLRRVTGLTIIDGKYVYIRGLGERYSNVLMNGTGLPSPDPTRRTVQLDLFPSGILESLVVQKSYSPDLPGNFGGGTVVLNTKNIPEEFTSKVSIGTSYASGNSNIKNAKAGSKDWLGMDDGTRALPDSIKNATSDGQRLFQSSSVSTGGYTEAELRSFSKDMPRNYNLNSERANIPPSLSLSIGDLYKHKGKKFGYLISGLYSNKWENDSKERFNYKSDGSEDNKRQIDTSKQTIKLSSMLNLGADFGKYAKITSNTLVLRKTTNKVTNDIKFSDSDSDANYRDIGVEWQERQLFTQALSGKHQIGSNKERMFEWSGSFSEAKRYQPDARNYQQDLKDGVYETSTAGKRNQKLYNNLTDRTTDVSAKFNFPLISAKSFAFTTRFGGQLTGKRRESETKRFKYGQINAAIAQNVTGNDLILRQSLQDICTNEVIDQGGCLLEDITDAGDRYSAKQNVTAWFLDTETNFGSLVRLNLGSRVERSEQSILTYQGVDRSPVESGLIMNDILPVAGATLFITDGLQLRSAYSETVSRPDFKDLNPGAYWDDEKGRAVNGNLGLKGTIIKNIDTRLEWYFGKNENVSIGWFNKKFFNPIEEVAGTFNDDGELVFAESKFQLANVGNATASGFEIEGRKSFSFLGSTFEYLSLGGNYSVIDSNMEIFESLSAQVTNQERPLQGQSPYVINVNLDYDNPELGMTATLLYNKFGERIDAVGIKPFGDVYEMPFEQLDFVFSQNFGKGNKIKFKLQNILDPDSIKTEDGRVKEIYKKGRSGSIGYTRTF